jgi:DNA repair photolyase
LQENIPVHEVQCKSALHKLKRKFPYSWDLNPYRGCAHGCIYCYAQDGHIKQGRKNFSGNIEVKTNIGEILETEIAAPTWQRQIINMGGVTDSYQPLEERYQLMPRILAACIRYRTPIIISTKSDLILRDKDLIAELAEVTYVNIAVTVTVMDERLRRILEPGAVPAMARLNVLSEFADTRVSRGLHVMPIIPYLTDDDNNLQKIFHEAAERKASYALCGTLYLRGGTRSTFFHGIDEMLPEQSCQLRRLYVTGGAPEEYKDGLYKRVNLLRDKYGLSGNYSRFIKERLHRV